MPSCLYNCRVLHHRYSPKDYAFASRIFMWLIDLDELDQLTRRIPLLSRNRRNVYAFRDDDHLHLGHPTLRANVEAYLHRQGITGTPHRIELLTNLRTFGHVFNPVSFFFAFDEQNQIIGIIVEVHNTFGELKPFFIHPHDPAARSFRSEHPKEFYISPFSDLDDFLEIRASLPGPTIGLTVNSRHPGEERPFFHSSLSGRRIPLTTRSLLGYTARFPFVTVKVVALIHFHAVRLYLKKVPFFRKKSRPHLQKGILPKKHQSSSLPS